jgi:act minimal PKS acyl carrier protein
VSDLQPITKGMKMNALELTVAELKELLSTAAGVPEGIDLGGEILDVSFDTLGYDSLALLETGSWIERIYGVQLADSVVTDAVTPRLLIAAVNALLTEPAA